MKRKLTVHIFLVFITALSARAQFPPVACFTAADILTSPCQILFYDLSTNSPTSWSWTFPGGAPSTSTAQYPVVGYSVPGIYSVTLTVSNGWGSDTLTKVGVVDAGICYYDTTISPCDSIASFVEPVYSKEAVAIYPNPFDTYLAVQFIEGAIDRVLVEIYDVNGRQVNTVTLNMSRELNTCGLPCGLYFYRIMGHNDVIQAGRIIKQ